MDTDVAPSRRESSVADPYRMLGITCAEPPIPTKPVFRGTPPPGEPPATMWQIYHRHSSPPNSRALPSSRTQTSCAMWSEAAKWLEKFPGGGRDRRGRRRLPGQPAPDGAPFAAPSAGHGSARLSVASTDCGTARPDLTI
jgi:hypothetical protein